MTSLRAKARDFAYARLGGTAVVLLYHRVAVLERDPQLLAVSPDNFRAQVQVLAKRYHVMSLEALISDLRKRTVRQRAVAVTFDDGYADNLLAAAPILQESGVPATVFVSSGQAASGAEFWWDEIERIVLSPGSLPEHLEIRVGERRFEGHLADAASYSEAAASHDNGWTVLDDDANERQALYSDLCAFTRPLSASDRAEVLRQLRDAAGASAVTRPSHRPLTGDEVAALDASGAVDVGAHTVSHQLLSARRDDEQRREIQEDRQALTRVLGHAPPTFSYPYGGLSDYTELTTTLVRQAGYEGACANHLGVVKPWSDPYRIPRIQVRDQDAEAFERTVEGWFDAPR